MGAFLRVKPLVRDSGAVLMAVAIMAVTLLVFAALAIDTALTTTSQSQMRYRAEFAALGALRKYHETPGDYLAKLEAARQRAEELAELNLSIGSAFEKNSGQGQGIGTSHSSSPTPHTGVITPGIWHRQAPATCTGQPSPCPCDGGQWQGACFQPLDLDDPAEQNITPTGFRADVYTRTTSPIKRTFGNLIGQDTMELSASATASSVPYHGVILLDISRSAHFETHIPYEQIQTGFEILALGYSVESAFELDGTTCPLDNSNPCAVHGLCSIKGGAEPEGHFDAIYNHPAILLPFRVPFPAPPITKHFKNDYQCFTSTYSDDGAPSQTVNYLVDTYRSWGAYDGPEPLTTLFRGINEIFSHLNNYPSRGDRLSLVGFDRSARIDIRTFPLSSPGSSDFGDVLLMTDIDAEDASSRLKRYQDHMFFPRTEGYTNYPEALRVAMDTLLAHPDAPNRENFVLLISDGLTNCTESEACGVTEADYLNSVSESMNILLNDYVENNIRFHMIIAGDLTQPHTMVSTSPNNPNQCMSDEDARLNDPPLNFVDASENSGNFEDVFKGDTSAGFYFDPMRFYEAVRATDGLWLPLRPCCESSGVCADVTAALDTACASYAAGTIPSRPEQPLPVVVNPHTDSDGRLTCDPEGRSRLEQLQAYVEQIFERNPYVLVE